MTMPYMVTSIHVFKLSYKIRIYTNVKCLKQLEQGAQLFIRNLMQTLEK